MVFKPPKIAGYACQAELTWNRADYVGPISVARVCQVIGAFAP